MKKFLNHRVLPFLCALSMLVSLMVVPVSAGNFGGAVELEFPAIRPEAFFDESGQLLESELNRLFGDNSIDHCAYFSEFAYIANKNNWAETSKENLTLLAYHWNVTYGSQYSSTASVDKHILDDGTELEYVRVTINDSRLGGSRNNWTWCLNDGAGKILVALPDEDDSITARGQWLQVNQTSANRVEMLPHDVLFNAAQDLGCSLFRMGNYWVIKKTMGVTEYVYSNADGERFVSQYEEEKWATNQERPTTNVTENGDIVEGDLIENEIGIDLSGMTVTLPDGTLNLIDKLIYDESTKTYYIDSHDTYNTENNYYVTNNYSWTYHINYTSITYIGQTEEYNKYYEVYYELPDGRDSADLTKEDLEQLNLSIDVIPYGRSADDTSLRSLYHFDGDTRDSSYWNYCTDFTWNTGASLTYMDAGVFDGALYLDETEHDFTITLPSNIGSSDFTIQFRYYQSATPAPVTDSYMMLSDRKIFQFDGSSLTTGNGTAVSAMPVGSWNEIAFIRSGNSTYWYLNGVKYVTGTAYGATSFGDTLNFHFGSDQQTFKYFDELRILHYAIAEGGANYEPTAVPHDTNLTLVLPDSKVPVADEYWSFKNDEQTNILSQYNLDVFYGTQNATNSRFKYSSPSYDITKVSKYYGFTGYLVDGRYSGFSSVNASFPNFVNVKSYSPLSFNDSGMSMEYTNFPSTLSVAKMAVDYSLSNYLSNFKTRGIVPSSGLFSVLAYNNGQQIHNLPAGDYTFSLVTDSGDMASVTFDIPSSMYSSVYVGATEFGTAYNAVSFTSTQVGGYEFGLMLTYCDTTGNGDLGPVYLLFVRPIAVDSDTESIVYMELVEGSETALEAEWVESVTAIDKADLNTPTLAVRTDIDITSYQIGGVRPSVPTKGQVWAMVENERIVSIQIYNGQAWEGVDGRIWTGQRWIPASSYNIITLQDMYDIVDATPNYEYIYSEAGFWAWWQKSWNAFTEKLFLTLGSGGTGGSGASGGAGSSELGKVDLDAADLPSDPADEDGKTLWQFIVLVVNGGKSVVSGTREMFSGVVSTIPDTMDDITGAFDSGGVAVGVFDGSDPDSDSVESEVLDPWRYR